MPNPEKAKFSKKAAKKGRYENIERFKKLTFYQLESKAWRNLNGNSIKIFLEICRRYNGSNNGYISFSYREGVLIFGMSKSTISNALKELEKFGFIKKNKIGTFFGRKASTFFLTDERYKDNPPTKDWKNYIPERRKKKITFGIKSVLKDAHEEIYLSKYDKNH